MFRWIIRVVTLAALALGAACVPAVAAAADVADCAGSRYDGGGYQFFDIDPGFVPPPMRSFSWDCAIRVADRPFDVAVLADGRYVQSVQYILLYVDMTFDELVEFYRAFERSGYAAGNQINLVSTSGGATQGVSLGAEELAALDPEPGYVNARFSNAPSVPPPSTPGSNIYELTWTDGIEFQSRSGIEGRPQLLASVILTEPFGRGRGVDDPSRLSDLRTLFEVAPSAAQWMVIGTGSVVLMLVIGWPSALLNSVVGSRYQAITTWVRTRLRRTPELGSAPPVGSASADDAAPSRPRGSGLPGWLMWPGFALAAILGAFVDPEFGVNWMSLRLVVTLFLSFVLFNLLAWEVVRAAARRLQPDSAPYLRFRWGSLVIVAFAVLVARILELQPGVIFGLVAGVAYAVTLQASRSAIITIVGSAFGLALSLVGWVGYSILAPVAISAGEPFPLVFLVEFLAGVTIKGISTLPLALLPLGNLDGAKVLRWKKWVWAASYALGLAAFMLVLLTIPKAWGEIPGDFVRWLLLFGGYAVLAMVIWAVNAWRLARRPPKPESEQGDQPDAITID